MYIDAYVALIEYNNIAALYNTKMLVDYASFCDLTKSLKTDHHLFFTHFPTVHSTGWAQTNRCTCDNCNLEGKFLVKSSMHCLPQRGFRVLGFMK